MSALAAMSIKKKAISEKKKELVNRRKEMMLSAFIVKRKGIMLEIAGRRSARRKMAKVQVTVRLW